jgi:type III secretion protein D
MHELRILSGLHRGATLPLDDQPHVIGSGDDDDVVLVDPGVDVEHATLSRTESGWLLSSTNGSVCDAESNEPQTLIDLEPGDFARIGKVWISVNEQDARWENPPPEPTDMPLFDPSELTEDTTGNDTISAASDAEFDDSGPATSDEPGHHATRRSRRRRIFSIPLMLAAALSAAAAYAMTSRPDEPSLETLDVYSDISSGSRHRVGKRPGDAISSTSKLGTAEPRTLTQAELREAFRKRLSDAYLLKRFDLTLNDGSWTMQAALDEEARRFERILTTFMSKHNITFPVHAKVGGGELMLPFKIRQVISGADASIVTQNGDRVYIGDVHRGVRLVAVQGNHLTFAGKRKIEVNW